MIDENFARLRAHRNNIHRYRQLWTTELTDLERQFIEKRLAEEQSALECLATTTSEPGPACAGHRADDIRLSDLELRG